jgi:putative ABC transport system substrate-binding protein
MKRREFIKLIAGAAISAPISARAKPQQTVAIGILDSASPQTSGSFLALARQGLDDAGYRNEDVKIDYSWAEGSYDELPRLANELAERQPAALFAAGLPAALALKATTTTIPVVFVVGPDPVSAGLVTSRSLPGSNLTGFCLYTPALVVKRLALLKEVAPSAVPIGFLVNPQSASAESDLDDVDAGARSFEQDIAVLRVGSDIDLYALPQVIAQRQIKALLVGNDPYLNSRITEIIALAASHSLPAIYGLREFAAAGGLMSCNTSLNDSYRDGFRYVGRILKGEKPGNLPVLSPSKFQFVFNLKTANALGLSVSGALLASADEVIR